MLKSVLIFQKRCRNITCFPGKIFSKDLCQPLLPVTRYLRYKMAFGFSVEAAISMPMDKVLLAYLNHLKCTIKSQLSNSNNTSNMFETILIVGNQTCNSSISAGTTFSGAIYFNIFLNSSVLRVKIEKTLGDFIYRIDVNNSYKFTNVKHFPNQSAYGLPSKLPLDSLDSNCYLQIPSPDMQNHSQGYIQSKVSPLLLCKQISLDKTEYKINHIGPGHSNLFLLRKMKLLSFDQFDVTPHGDVRVCVDVLRELNYFDDELANDLWTITTVCNTFSIVCLVLALVTYLLFPSLRTVPGKLIICFMIILLLTLLCETLSYTIANTPHGCVIIGIFRHFLWLGVFSSMHVCNFHMFKVFRQKTNNAFNNVLHQRKILCKYFIYAAFCPLSFVIISIITHFLIHKNSSMGYGGVRCFIVNDVLRIIFFILPIGIICFSNAAFFISTIFQIHNTRVVASNREARNDFLIFVKLTTITGVSWVFQIIDSFLTISAFSYFSTTLNSLQGTLVCFAFIANKNFYSLYRNLFLNMKSSNFNGIFSRKKTISSNAQELEFESKL